MTVECLVFRRLKHLLAILPSDETSEVGRNIQQEDAKGSREKAELGCDPDPRPSVFRRKHALVGSEDM